jgi:hypothetical protein
MLPVEHDVSCCFLQASQPELAIKICPIGSGPLSALPLSRCTSIPLILPISRTKILNVLTHMKSIGDTLSAIGRAARYLLSYLGYN